MEIWHALRYRGRPGQWFGPMLMRHEGSGAKYYHGSTRSFMFITDNEETDFIKEYEMPFGKDEDGYTKRVIEIELEFEHDFPISEGVERSSGWIAPNGKFYACLAAEHYESAMRLTALYYNNFDGSTKLEDEGWWKVYWNGHTISGKGVTSFEITQQQLDTLGDLLVLEEGNEVWRDRIRTTIEFVEVK